MGVEKLVFKLGAGGDGNPRWVRVRPANIRCPECQADTLVVMIVPEFPYAWCHQCHNYFVGVSDVQDSK